MDQSSENNIGFTSTHSSIGVKKKNSKIWIIVVLILVLLIGGYFIYSNSRNNEPPKETVLPTEAPIATPTEEATPSGTITPTKAAAGEVKSAADLNIQVLNGSGAEGAAGGVRDFLSEQGYKNLSTGNADNFDYEKVSIRIKSAYSKFLSTLQKDLEEKYEIGTGSGTLDADNEFDAAVIVGK
ncbi:hypothetical protein A3G67_02110 [Candidatus Roizmanbacteria bacterium RIFCSPLOWO2_12_FULL_40_12]|uniref:LytR/CpsA/Psr regulator C-terminal domain-containing protein n=1 Tax=Candidatus Roizmanbacteria bacterium RIFCSPLOWO2_01_FULL_40_42 TaxID=1802066 RepID=A0A1F7J3P7_9BACT|nr:MAG: hypothetical protein A2779_01230 [Candidatus Roizmanbacteria bacterium RIFCSPHIGHO2_01_FULL_40_98]OGK28985.1 MAG: hypothetical protein A3C31_01870 [Candidatus Roizmanbacteria bacterium RIFCSPHIGHO2_02_FULL_40_53]OGK29549.1 MAG: hypothetical protein A2W49_03670 [Candidatus Roizmanbacteria bacterium RIFCSPHIGHO2_12_41_18]OGK37272.1 MAG: hypothetical protein A3E69_04170 [Candidatus Roizmanbacteria bacterium RIFCSPHIGHO2_12_FULL_40_130]OGK50214.1 MAG: hypothetical protein A3B50_00325 [Candi